MIQGQSAAISGNVLQAASQSGPTTATITTVAVEGGGRGTVGQPLTTALGTFTLNSNGSYSFTIADTIDVKALAANQTQDVVFTFTAQNSVGSTSSTLKFTVTGINDTPVASNDSVTAPVILTAPVTGNVLANDTDIDRGTTLTITNIAAKASQSGASQSGSAQAALSAQGVYGTISIESNGSYSYRLDKSDPDFLALRDGQEATETFKYSVSDGQGGTATAELSIALTGVNEGPQVAPITQTLDLRTSYGDVSVDIAENIVDYEGDTGLLITSLGGVPIERQYDYDFGYFSYFGYQQLKVDTGDFYVFTSDPRNPTAALSGRLYFSLDSTNAQIIALKDGETLAQTVTYAMADGRGGISENTVTINIIGRDDAPILKTPLTAYQVSAASPNFTVKLSDLIVDPEGGATSITSVGNLSDFVGKTFTTYTGSGMINADSTVTFTLDINSNGYRAASANIPYQDAIIFTGSDGKLTNYFSVPFQVTGVNDAPTANPATASINFDQTSTTSYPLYNASDPDSGDPLTLSAIAGQSLPTATTLSSVAGLLTATVDGSNTLVVAVNRTNTAAANLAYGAQLTDTFSYTVKDTAGATASSTLTVTLTGTKQTPTTGNDTLYLTQLADSFNGLDGNDHFIMVDQRYSSNSTGFNGAGDNIVGGSGSDTLDFRNGYSFYQGIVVDLTKSTPIKLTGYSADIQQDTIVSGVENVYATSQGDRLFGSVDANILYGSGGNDDLSGLAGNDILIGGADFDTASGGAGDDLIIAEYADGGAGNDMLVLLGGYQSINLLLRGGTGADTFIVSTEYSYSQYARIADFSHADGDKIDLSALRDASGNVLDLQDIIDHSTIIGDSVQIALDTFLSGGNAVRGTLTLDGISSVPALVAGDFIFSGGSDWKALIPSDLGDY